MQSSVNPSVGGFSNPFSAPIATHPSKDLLTSLYHQTHIDFHSSPSPNPEPFSFKARHAPQTDYHYAFFSSDEVNQEEDELVGGEVEASSSRRATEWDVGLGGKRKFEAASITSWDRAMVHSSTVGSRVENVRPYLFVRMGERSVAVPEQKILTSLPTFPEKYTRKKHFPIEKYVELFEDTQLGSSSPLSPEVDTILYQLLHRLLALQPELSLSHLDSLSVLPLTTKDITSLPHSTDLIPFPHPNPSSHIFPAAPVANSLEWDGQISRNVESARRKAPESLRDVQGDSEALFCPMMGCGLYDCSAHAAIIQKDEDIQPKERPLANLSSIVESGSFIGPCTDGCFLLAWPELEPYLDDDLETMRENVADRVLPWPEEHTEELLDLMRSAPGLSSCGMVDVICDLDGYSPLYTCREYFEQMILHGPRVVPRKTRKIEGRRPKRGWSNKYPIDLRPTSLKPNRSCNHTGPCSQIICTCHKARQHCLPSCHCPSDCRRRHLFCDCHRTASADNREKGKGRKTNGSRGELCRTRQCRCWRDNRECDPVGCGSCGARDEDGGSCGNVCIQKGRHVQVRVKEASYGYGLFLAPGVKVVRDDFLLEYIGEIVDDNEADKRGIFTSYIGSNYLFDLNKVQGLDALEFGNPSRFINQPEVRDGVLVGQPNCYARTLDVLGEQRIGIFAAHAISSPNEEILLDYGAYFQIEPSSLEERAGQASQSTSKMARKSGFSNPVGITSGTRLVGTSSVGSASSMGDGTDDSEEEADVFRSVNHQNI